MSFGMITLVERKLNQDYKLKKIKKYLNNLIKIVKTIFEFN